ncbi:hypothetical protein LDO26_13680 [Luteimonas sp. BDR2-5]|nr:hypothetical protein [Luteimonas sp. BDR2-5]MCD9029249.1 hypothetical protein [Luteimonas sp. BDR2-5]
MARALLLELAAHPGGAPSNGVSLPRLCKRLGVRMSVLLRTLAYLGDDSIGGVAGTGWIRTVEDGPRTLALLTDTGRAVAAAIVADGDTAAE